MIKESGWIPQSIHESRKGAESALESHRKEVLKEWEDMFKTPEEQVLHPIETTQDWRLCEYELLD